VRVPRVSTSQECADLPLALRVGINRNGAAHGRTRPTALKPLRARAAQSSTCSSAPPATPVRRLPVPRGTLGHSRALSGTLGHSRALSGTLGYSRVLSGTLGYSRVLSGTLGYSRVLSGTLGYSRVPYGHRGTLEYSTRAMWRNLRNALG
jgi:hypothetical protein